MVIFSCLFAAINNEHKLAAILAHEVAHVLAKHAAEDRSESALSWLLFGPFLPIVPAALLIQELGVLLAIPLITYVALAMAQWRDGESEADCIGMLLMTEAGFHPRGAVTVFRKLKALDEKSKQLTLQRNTQESGFLSTHPHVSRFLVIVV